MKRVPSPGVLSHADAAAHRRRQFLADRQAQAAAAVARRGARTFGLLEAAEQARLLFLVEARAGIGDLEAHALRRQRTTPATRPSRAR